MAKRIAAAVVPPPAHLDERQRGELAALWAEQDIGGIEAFFRRLGAVMPLGVYRAVISDDPTAAERDVLALLRGGALPPPPWRLR